jgi:hypothetical protein
VPFAAFACGKSARTTMGPQSALLGHRALRHVVRCLNVAEKIMGTGLPEKLAAKRDGLHQMGLEGADGILAMDHFCSPVCGEASVFGPTAFDIEA